MRICYSDENDQEFVRWTANLLRSFIDDGSVTLVGQDDRPDLMIAGVWRPHPMPPGIPVILISNESWRLFPPHYPLSRYKAVIGIYPPAEACTFIRFPYAAVHFNRPIEELYRSRLRALMFPKSRFCCFVVSNNRGELSDKRLELFRVINSWRGVDSAGVLENNMQGTAPHGLRFQPWIAQYKYMICLENMRDPGYITEKPFQSWFASTVPIYDGGETGALNPAAFINAGTTDVLAELQRLEDDPAAYEQTRHAPLTDTPLSLSAFENEFRRSILN